MVPRFALPVSLAFSMLCACGGAATQAARPAQPTFAKDLSTAVAIVPSNPEPALAARAALQELAQEDLASLGESPLMKQWQARAASGDDECIAVLAVEDRANLGHAGVLDALARETETWLSGGRAGTVVRHEQAERAVGSDAKARVAYGKSVAARYLVASTLENKEGEVALSMQVLDAQNGSVVWQHTSRPAEIGQ